MSRTNQPVYLDYHATTPVDARVLETMMPWFHDRFGNAASRSHIFGWQAAEAVEIARNHIGQLIQADPKTITFDSGATEGLNMAIKGLADSYHLTRNHIITVTTEHHAVLDVMQWLESKGREIDYLNVDAKGNLDLKLLASRMRAHTLMVCVMLANNETGVIHDLAAVAAFCKSANVPLICDTTQALGKINVDVQAMGIDVLVCSAHKFYGPKGIGIIYINPQLKTKITPLIHGGGHEAGLRSGTLNVPAIVGMGEAARICTQEMNDDMNRIQSMRDRFEKQVLREIEAARVNGDINNRLPTVSNICVPFTESQAVITKFRNKLAISSGSACSSADPSPSHVLLAMGLTDDEAKASYRFSFGRPTTEAETDEAIQLFVKAINEYRDQNPVWQMHKSGVIS